MAWWRRVGEHRWALWVVLTALTIDAVLIAAVFAERRGALLRAEQNVSSASSAVLAQAVDLFFSVDRTLTGINEVLAVRGSLRDRPDRLTHDLLLRRHALTPALRWLAVVRPDGSLAEYSLGFPAPQLDLREQPFFNAQAAADQGFFIGRVQGSGLDSETFIPTSRRAIDARRWLGVVAAGIDPTILAEVVARNAPPGVVIRLYLLDGHALACSQSDVPCAGEDFSATPLFAGGVVQRPGEGSGQDLRLTADEPGIAAHARSDRYPLVTSAEVSRDFVLAAWRQSLRHYVLVGAASNLALIMLAVFAAEALGRQAAAMAELAETNARLEERVAERTRALTISEARARAFMNTAMDAIIVIDETSRVLEFNPIAERMFGFSAKEILGGDVGRLMPLPTARMHAGEVAHSTVDNAVRPMGRGREVVARRKDGAEFPVEVTIGTSKESGRKMHVGIVRDITERKAAELELQRLATTDGLTGVLNRRAFVERADADFLLARRHGRPLAVLVLDADHFKRINDSYGHHVGDAVLRALTTAVGDCLRDTDLFGRLGGEEFGLVLPETDRRGASELGQRLLAAVRACRVAREAGEPVAFTVSIGAALLEHEDKNIEALLRRADVKLYEAKSGGRDLYVG
jgi:diguanylate cyclase (GGDEF)-like protein/PAS domain S-box-containing protein